MIETKVKQVECGGCVFCQSWCPRCKSNDVRIHFVLSILYDVSEEKDRCRCRLYRAVKLNCQECGLDAVDEPRLDHLTDSMVNMLFRQDRITCSAGKSAAKRWTTGQLVSGMMRAMGQVSEFTIIEPWKSRRKEEV